MFPGVLAVILPSLYLYTAGVVSSRFPKLQNKRICLLIAHPDDEAMFFSPSVLALTRPETGNHVKILCLSSGTHAILAPFLSPFPFPCKSYDNQRECGSMIAERKALRTNR